MSRRQFQRICTIDESPQVTKIDEIPFLPQMDLKVSNVSASGFMITGNFPPMFFKERSRMTVSILLPYVGVIQTKVAIMRKILGEQGITLGCHLVNPTQKVRSSIGKYLLARCDSYSFRSLRELSLKPASIASLIHYSRIKTKDEYDEVLRLRHASYLDANKLNASAPLDDVKSPYDKFENIFVGKFHDKIVCSGLVIVNEDFQRFEVEDDIGRSFVGDLMERSEAFEVTKLCIDPSFKGSDLFFNFLKLLNFESQLRKKRYIILSADSKLLPIYKKFGGKAFEKISFEATRYKNSRHTFVLMDTHTLMKGKGGLDPLTWSVLWGDFSHGTAKSFGQKLDLNINSIFYHGYKGFKRIYKSIS